VPFGEPAVHPYRDRFAVRPGRDAADEAVIHRFSAEMSASGGQRREDDYRGGERCNQEEKCILGSGSGYLHHSDRTSARTGVKLAESVRVLK
jgi:hypothetical protein